MFAARACVKCLRKRDGKNTIFVSFRCSILSGKWPDSSIYPCPAQSKDAGHAKPPDHPPHPSTSGFDCAKPPLNPPLRVLPFLCFGRQHPERSGKWPDSSIYPCPAQSKDAGRAKPPDHPSHPSTSEFTFPKLKVNPSAQGATVLSKFAFCVSFHPRSAE